MWVLIFVGMVQGALLAERVLNRVVLLVLPTERSETKKLSDRLVLSAFAAQIWSTVATLLSMALLLMDTLVRNAFLVVGVAAVMVALTVLADNNAFIYVMMYNAYNNGLGYMVYLLVIAPIEIAHTVFGVLLPIWNGALWLLGRIAIYIVFPVIQASPNEIPLLLENISLFAASLGFSLFALVENILECVVWDNSIDDNGQIPFAEPSMQCIANSNHITLDLMTPGLYMRNSMRSLVAVLAGSCSVATPLLEVLLYPALDYNFYKTIHCSVQAVLHAVVALPIMTYQRCEYGKTQHGGGFGDTERAVMCMPDWTPMANIVSAAFRALGQFLDNWLNVVLMVVEKSVGLAVDVCSTAPTLGSVWKRVGALFGATASLRMVGLTSVMYAVTDGDSTAYHTLVDGTQLQLALSNWPFLVDTRYGIAAVQYAEVLDTDAGGGDSTGMFGCACLDSASGMVLSCASIPYQVVVTDGSEAYAQSTVHPMVFDAPYAASTMRCAEVQIQVLSLRFSRRRYSQSSGGVEHSLNDPHQSNSAARTLLSNTADAAVYIHPKCQVAGTSTDEKCLKDTAANCFPWCMGLHIAGRKNQKIVLYNQRAWEENVNMAQTDCVIGADDRECVLTDPDSPRPSTSSMAFSVRIDSACDFMLSRCAQDDNAETWRPSSAESRETEQGPKASIRLQQQPFVAAGDVFLYESTDADGSRWLVVARLRSSGSSEFSVQQDRLSMNSNAMRRRVYHDEAACNLASNDACYRNAVRSDQVVMPRAFSYWSRKHNTVALSEWSVHWADEPELSVLSCVWAKCLRIPSLCVEVSSSFGRARVWTMRTVRATHTMGVETTEAAPSVSFMTVPDFISPTTECHETVNVLVVGLEYLNSNNLLLTTKATSPSNFFEGLVLDESLCQYRYYFIHPNRADCLDVTDGSDAEAGSEAVYSCWREDSVGMFADETEIYDQAPVRTCPAMQRMPQLGSMAAELGVAAVLVVRMFAHLVCVLPAAASTAGGVYEVFSSREHLTHHSVLDTDGSLLLDIDSIVFAMQMHYHHLWGTLGKISDMLRGRPGHDVLEGMLLGTSKVLEHMEGVAPLSGPALGVFAGFTSSAGPLKQILAESSILATTSPVMRLPPAIAAMRRMFLTTARSGMMMAKLAKRLLYKMLRARFALASLSSALITSTLYESQVEIRHGWLDNVRAQCDGLAQILSRTNPWARLVKHACLLGPDGVDGFVQVLLTLTVEYPIMHCVCKLGERGNTVAVVEEVCLQGAIPIAYSAWMKAQRGHDADGRQSVCFQSMDAANRQLQGAFDPFMSRLFKLTQAAEASIDYMTVAYQQDAGNCEDVYGSAYVMTIMPDPVDYFMQCMHTFDCRARCLDTHTAFETALAEIADPPVFRYDQQVTVENRLFSREDVENNRHLPPFVVKRIQQLPTDTCVNVVCRNTRSAQHSRCLAAVGVDTDSKLAMAYYCVPADISQFMFAHADLPFVDGHTTYATVPGEFLSDVFLITTDRVKTATRYTEALLTLSMRNGVWSLHVLESGLASALAIFQTRPWDSEQFDRSLPATQQPMHRIDKVWVINSDSCAFVYVGGQRMTATVAPASSMSAYVYDSEVACTVLRVPFDALVVDVNAIQRADCTHYVDAVLSQAHTNVCVAGSEGRQTCSTILAIPLQNAGHVRVSRFDAQALFDSPPTDSGESALWHTEEKVAKTRRGRGIANALQMDDRSPLYLTQAGAAAEKRRHMSSIAYSSIDAVLVFVTGDPRQSWIQTVQLSQVDGEYGGGVHGGTPLNQSLSISVPCSIDNCVGCMPSTTSNSENPGYVQLQGKCLAAQQCSIVRCVGTTVNMRKPLCNMGKVLSSALDVSRVSFGGMWLSLSRSIIVIVELSKGRRKQYELDWPQEAFNAALCNTKDGLVETIATVTSIAGFASWVVDSETGPDTGARSSKIDTRFHAHSVLVLASLTNFLAALFMGPLYLLLAAEKTITCTGNDIILALDNADQDGEALFVIGSKAGNAATSAAVAMCMSEQMGQSMRDISTQAKGATNEAVTAIEQLQDAITMIPFEPFQHGLDAFFAYWIGVVTGLLDVLQTSDIRHCKLPVVGGSHMWQCVCGDRPAQIPDSNRRSKDSAYWCQGPLLLNTRGGEDILVWNPYSLHDLLQKHDYDAYLACLHDDGTSCATPNERVFAEQGVEIMQVINRCRANYQQKQWDEGAMMLGLFTPEDWQRIRFLGPGNIAAAEGMQRLKMRMMQISKWISQAPAESLITCFRSALLAGVQSPVCMQEHLRAQAEVWSGTDEYFEYTHTDKQMFVDVDACESFTGDVAQGSRYSSVGAVWPLFVWSGSSSNKDPVASRHLVVGGSLASRVSDAEAQLKKMFDDEIDPFFRQNRPVADGISVSSWSMEGDELHQFVDCVMMGPYAAANIHATFSMSNSEPFPVEQYHRHSPASRDFAPTMATGGSDFRRRIMAGVQQTVDAEAQEAVSQQARYAMDAVRSMFSDPGNLRCPCAGGGDNSVSCCFESKWTVAGEITFPAKHVLDKEWDMREGIVASIMQSIIDSKLLSNTAWTDTKFNDKPAAPVSQEQAFEMHRMYLFDPERPVMEYSQAEILPASNSGALWDQCMSLLSAAFFTLPIVAGSDPPVVDADMRYDPTQPTETYLHGMEAGVRETLRRARRESPVYWTHVHRYMPSNSMWCEERGDPAPVGRSSAELLAARSFTQPAWMGVSFDSDILHKPGLAEVASVASLGVRCFCGWEGVRSAGLACSIHPGVNCAAVLLQIPEHDQATRTAWEYICARREYATRDALFVVMQAMNYAAAPTPDCVDMQASTVWGLMDRDQQHRWWEGQAADLDLQELSTLGPAGLRVGLLGNGPSSLHKHVEKQQLRLNTSQSVNYKLRHTIAQPYCEDSKSAYLAHGLREYFQDVLFPMAHSVHESPVAAYCSTWAIEVAILDAFVAMQASSELQEQQRQTAQTWRERCSVQLQQIGICQLRGVYDMAPLDGRATDSAHCAFSTAGAAQQCVDLFYVTPNCLVMCDGSFHDPCVNSQGDCSGVTFAKIQAPVAFDARVYATNNDVRLFSMHWPSAIALREARNASDQLALQQALETVAGRSGFHAPELHATVRQILLAREAETQGSEGHAPEAFCDDLLDYSDADAQHPVGYHPTCACGRNDTYTRGFDTWMSTDEVGVTQLDGTRLRNMTEFSSLLGHSHVLCDGAVYGQPARSLNPYFLESRWDANAKADPFVPVLGTWHTATMQQLGTNDRKHAFDTPLVSSAGDGFRHSLGLVRDWPRRPAGPYIPDGDPWPLWDAAASSVYGTDAQAYDAGCHMPAQLTCVSDAECVALAGEPLVCQKNADNVGVCGVRLSETRATCFAHHHCSGQDMMCSGAGLCEQAQVSVRNRLGSDVYVQLFAKTCTTDTYGLSEFQGVSDFASSNGMCGAKNRWQYLDTVRGTQFDSVLGRGTAANIRSVDAQSSRFFAETEARSLWSEGVLRPAPHACDKTYQHTDHGICTRKEQSEVLQVVDYGSGGQVADAGEDAHMWAMGTWEKKNGGVRVRFCDIEPNSGLTGFLSPYKYHPGDGYAAQDTLLHVPDTILPCSKFDTCPGIHFVVDAVVVARRVVVVVSVTKDTRTYTNVDSDRCFGMGYRIQNKQALGSSTVEYSELCVVDRFVVPLISAVFNDPGEAMPMDTTCRPGNPVFCVESLNAKFDYLRDEGRCPHAFGRRSQSTTDTRLAFDIFVKHFEETTRHYIHSEAESVLAYVNSLLPWLFGIDKKLAAYRGFSVITEYQSYVSCASYLVDRMTAISAAAAISGADYEMTYDVDIGRQVAPGRSLYMFQQRAAIYIPFRWFWQCVLMDGPARGARADWYTVMTDSTYDISEIPCTNYEESTRPGSEKIPLKELLQTSRFIFETRQSVILPDSFLEQDVVHLVQEALLQFKLGSVPNVDTVRLKTSSNLQPSMESEVFVFPKYDAGLSSWEKISTAVTVGLMNKDSETVQQDIVSFLSGGSLRGSVADMVTNNVLSMRSFTDTLVERDAINVPRYYFTKLRDDLIVPPGNAEYRIQQAASDYVITSHYGDDTLEYARGAMDGLTLTHKEFAMRWSSAETYPDLRLSESNIDDDYLQGRTSFTREQVSYMVLRHLKALLPVYTYMSAENYRKTSNLHVESEMRSLAAAAPDDAAFIDIGPYKRYNVEMSHKSYECSEFGVIMYDSETNNAFQELRACHRALQQKVGWVLAADKHLKFSVSTDVLMRGFYPAFTQRVARVNGEFVTNMTSGSWSNSAWRGSNADSKCFARDGDLEVLNPFLPGAYDEGIGCETQRVDGDLWSVKGTCNTDCAESWRDLVQTQFASYCSTHDREVVYRRDVQTHPSYTGVCSMQFAGPELCPRHHGSIGGNRGERVRSLHDDTVDASIAEYGLWHASNAVMRGGNVDFSERRATSSLRMLASDIGGHAVTFDVTPLGQLKVAYVHMHRMPAQSFQTPNRMAHEWMGSIEETWKRSNSLYHESQWRVSEQTAHAAWTCPLQRLAAHYSRDREYAMRYPSAKRNAVRFRHITTAALGQSAPHYSAHPTVHGIYAVKVLRPGRFMSEFLVCTSADIDADCSAARDYALRATLQQLRSALWQTVKYVPGAAGPCLEALDWPVQHAALVDADSYAGSQSAEASCNVYDRLPDFQLRLSQGAAGVPSAHLTSAQGVCRMGRLRRIGPSSLLPAHTIQHCSQSESELRCVVRQDNARRQNTTFAASRPTPRARRQVHKRDRRCGTCDSHVGAKFVRRDGSSETLTPTRHLMSVGVPVQLSTARVIAGHIRHAVCGTLASCPQLEALLSFGPETWEKSGFLRSMLNVSFADHVAAPDDSALWERPWVWCNGSSCQGSIAKDTWLQPKTREQVCAASVTASVASSKLPVHFCLIDAGTAETCRRVLEWQSSASSIICRALGFPQCQEDAHYYAPTTYSSSNGEFVHDTVQAFYDGIDADACAVDLTDTQREQMASNERTMQKCASQSLVPLRLALQIVRTIKTIIIELLYYAVQAVLQLAWMIVGMLTMNTDVIERAGDKLLMYVGLYIEKIAAIMAQLARMIFKVVFGRGIPKQITAMVKFLCQFMNMVNRYIIGTSKTNGVLCFLTNAQAEIAFLIADVLKHLMDISILGAKPFEAILKVPYSIVMFLGKMLANMLACSEDAIKDCNFDDTEEDNASPGALPTSTRCFSTYATFYGDANPLSCTAADTCDTSLVDRTLRVCGSCQQAASGIPTTRFACSPITKQCTCNVPVLGTTQCSANADCYDDQACRWIDGDFVRTFGSIPCSDAGANSRMCFLEEGRATAYCAVAIHSVEFATCTDEQLGQTVQLPVDAMCLHTRDTGFARSNAFVLSYDELMTVPCNDVVAANAFCVSLRDGAAANYIVASSIAGVRTRRLLAHSELAGNITRSALCRDALDGDSLPATRRACAAAYEYSSGTVRLLGMRDVLPECMFCSVDDFMHAVLENPLLIPVLGAHPVRLAHIVGRHTPLHHVMKALAALRTTVRLLSMDVQPNRTSKLLVDLAAFLDNRTASRSLLSLAESQPVSSLSDFFAAQGASFAAKFDEMKRVQRAYAQTLSSLLRYEPDSTYASSLWDDSVVRPGRPTADVCTPLIDFVRLVKEASASTKAYYTQPPPAVPHHGIDKAWPSFRRHSEYTPEQPQWDPSLDAVTATAVWCVRAGMAALRIDTANTQGFFASMIDLLQNAVKCDLRQVQTCSAWTVRLFDGVFVVTCYALCAYFVMSAFGFSLVAIMLLPTVPLAAMYVCYGYSPACLPLVPTCFLLDLYTSLELFFPRRLYVPYALFRKGVSAEGIGACEALLTMNCLTSCSLPPFEYQDWKWVLAWAAAEVGPGLSKPVEALLLASGFADDLPVKIMQKRNVFAMADDATVYANRICAFVSLYKIIPLLFISFLVLVTLFALSRLMLSVLFALMVLLVSVFVSVFTQ